MRDLLLLASTAAGIGALHTLLGPDHYLPFVAIGRARGWTLGRTLRLTALCGGAHLAGSLVLGALALGFGWSLSGIEGLDSLRGSLAGWLLLGFGFAYLLWGLRDALRSRPHRHWHAHADGTLHDHEHGHHGTHAHLHDAEGRRRVTVWALFLVFVLGPCEPLIPLLLVPASLSDPLGVAVVLAAFSTTTLAVMLLAVAAGHRGLSRLPGGRWERWSHVLAGLLVVACGLAVEFGL